MNLYQPTLAHNPNNAKHKSLPSMDILDMSWCSLHGAILELDAIVPAQHFCEELSDILQHEGFPVRTFSKCYPTLALVTYYLNELVHCMCNHK